MKTTSAAAAVLAVLGLAVGTPAAEEKSKFIKVFVGNVLDTTGSVPRSSTRFTLMVKHHTTDEEAQELAGVLRDGG